MIKGTRLRVPYVSQNGAGASYGVGDCGLACVTALARSAGRNVTVDNVSVAAGLMIGYKRASVLTVKRAAGLFGVTVAWRGYLTPDQLMAELDNQRAIILLVWYPMLHKKRLPNYRDGHFIVLHGYEQTEAGIYFYYDDPEWYGAKDGEDIRISGPALMVAMYHKGTHAKTPGQGLVLRSHQLPVVNRAA